MEIVLCTPAVVRSLRSVLREHVIVTLFASCGRRRASAQLPQRFEPGLHTDVGGEPVPCLSVRSHHASSIRIGSDIDHSGTCPPGPFARTFRYFPPVAPTRPWIPGVHEDGRI